jgi:hypothetical protein
MIINPEHFLVFDDSYITLRFASNFLRYKAITYDGSTYLEPVPNLPISVACTMGRSNPAGTQAAKLHQN